MFIRAYIAASRRSDRSLEARVESARRASEIHKKRTGRALRVTEQDVINEEMYEEEDDGLPLSYRRLTAHLQTGSADFNRRLAAYLANQVAMRSAVDHMVHNQYAAAFPNAPQYAHNNPNSFDNPFLNNFVTPPQPNQQQPQQSQQAPSPTQQQPQQLPSPQETTRSPPTPQVSSPISFRATPYPPPQSLKNAHSRAQSIAAASASRPNLTSPVVDSRRLSMPAPQRQSSSPVQVKVEPPQQQTTPQMTPQNFVPDTGPLTTTLPAESQMFFGAGFGLDPNDSFTNMLMGGSAHNNPWTSYNFDNNPSKNHPSYNGLSATLAPSDLDKTSTVTSNPYDMSSSWNFRLDPSALKTQAGNNDYSENVPRQMTGADALITPGQMTPGDNMWESFLEQGTWDEPSTTTTG